MVEYSPSSMCQGVAIITLHAHISPGWSGQGADAEMIVLNSGISEFRFSTVEKGNHLACVAFDFGINQSFIMCRSTKTKVAVLWEPRQINEPSINSVMKLSGSIDLILTHDSELLQGFPEQARAFVVGGSYLWDQEKLSGCLKPRKISISSSKKRVLEGHLLRHDVIKKLRARGLAVWGGGYRPYKSPSTPHQRYRFSVVIENSREDFFFTEKLVHCMLFRTVPLYWGARVLPAGFREDGLIRFETVEELDSIWKSLTASRYREMLPAIIHNQRAALEYSSSEVLIGRAVGELIGNTRLGLDSVAEHFDDVEAVLAGEAPFKPVNRAERPQLR